MTIGKFNCGCISLLRALDAVIVLPCHAHRGQIGTTVMRGAGEYVGDATFEEQEAVMAELHSAMKDAYEHRANVNRCLGELAQLEAKLKAEIDTETQCRCEKR